jgi:2-polyprenyl-3-methyl-5-hydroxy-6-metoxy-1,4-benzoquinol methylase
MLMTATPSATAASAVTCPICAAPSAVEHQLEDFTLCRCSRCDHCFTDLNSIDCAEQYQAEYFEEEHRNWFLHPDLVLYEKLTRIILGRKPKAAILDVGCGNGNLLRYLRSRGIDFSLTGIDMAPNERAAGIEYLRGGFFEQKFDRQFDVLVSLAVIEHIPNVALFAERLSEVCAPGGLVITMTVDERSLIYGAARALHRAGYSVPLKRLYSKHHLNHFTHHSLKRLLEGQKLRTVQVLRHNTPMSAVDTPKTSRLANVILKAGLWAAFQAGMLTRRTMLQTIISEKPDSRD